MSNFITGLATSAYDAPIASIGILLLIFFIMFLVMIGVYVYTSLALMAIANKTKTEPAWLAWIPIGNMVLVAKIAMMHWWPVLLYIPAFIFMLIGVILGQIFYTAGIIFMALYYLVIVAISVFATIWYWKIFKRVGRPGWWSIASTGIGFFGGLLMLIPTTATKVLGIIMTIGGMILMLVFIGIAAWGNAPVPIVKKKK